MEKRKTYGKGRDENSLPALQKPGVRLCIKLSPEFIEVDFARRRYFQIQLIGGHLIFCLLIFVFFGHIYPPKSRCQIVCKTV
jgi:hypothetical protein